MAATHFVARLAQDGGTTVRIPTFSLRHFLLNHSPVYRWADLSPELRDYFPVPNAMLLQAECFVADPRRRLYRFELIEEVAGEAKPKRHRADVVIIQSWSLMTLVRFGTRPRDSVRFTGLRDTVIVSAEYVARRSKA